VVVGSSAAGTPEFHRNDASMTRGSLRGVDEGESRSAKPFLASPRREEAESGLTTKWSGRRSLAPVEVNGEGGRRDSEGLVRCGILRGSSGRLL
jgi:hypothetical protein